MSERSLGQDIKTLKAQLLRALGFRLDWATLKRPSVLALLAANLFPLVGVAALGWDTFLVLALFWLENVVVGVYTGFRLLLVSNATVPARLRIVLFFCVHYGMFTVIHGLFVFLLFGSLMSSESGGLSGAWQTFLSSEILWGAVFLLVSHGVSFVYNYVYRGEYRRATLQAVMMEPYGRVVLLHVTIIFGGFLVMLLGSPVVGLVLLVALKTIMDLRAHLRQHDKYGEGTPQTA